MRKNFMMVADSVIGCDVEKKTEGGFIGARIYPPQGHQHGP
jgi:hypothetical protein